jgi:hypothetical protein
VTDEVNLHLIFFAQETPKDGVLVLFIEQRQLPQDVHVWVFDLTLFHPEQDLAGDGRQAFAVRLGNRSALLPLPRLPQFNEERR